jgi:hypothetical protein
LEARGILRLIEWLDGDRASIAVGAPVVAHRDAETLWQELDALLAEVRAYRRFVLRARVEDLGLTQGQ